jgi:hypothetical protein
MAVPKRKLDFEEQEDLQAICEKALREGELKANEQTFLVDMAERFQKYGDRTMVSEKQWSWLVAIGSKVGISA